MLGYMDTYALFFVLAFAAMAIVVGIYVSHRLRNCARPAASRSPQQQV